MPQPIASINDFVVKFANVNGSGSASANTLFAKSFLRMGVPVATRNIFPSNIQGLPTWYEVRVSGEGYIGRRGGVDLMVAMNPQTWAQDIASIDPGGYLFYDSTKPMPPSKFRDDINIVGMPLTEICNRTYTDPRQRQLFKNIIYVGALAALLDIELAAIETLIGEQYKGKDKLMAPNIQALHMGHDYAKSHLPQIGLKVKRADKVGDRIFIDGNSAAALGAVYGGATVAAWYPITPSTSLAEAFMRYCRRYRTDPDTGKARYAIVQAEDELASIGIVIGAAWNGARAFTCTAGPGVSLMTEFLGLAYFAEIPAVLFDVQRGGPSTGMPTRTQQSDIISCAYASHGDTKHPLLFPEDPGECFEMGAQAFDLADRLQTPIFVMLDLDIGMNEWLVPPLRLGRQAQLRPRQGHDARRARGRQGFRPLSRRRRRRHSVSHVSRHAPDARSVLHPRHLARPLCQIQRAGRGLCRQHGAAAAQVRDREEARPGAGVTRRQAEDEIRRHLFRLDHGLDARGAGRARSATASISTRCASAAFPFADEVVDFVRRHEQVFLVEQNRDAQLRTLLINECGIDPARVVPVLHYDGTPITARFINGAISERLAALKVAPLREVAR